MPFVGGSCDSMEGHSNRAHHPPPPLLPLAVLGWTW